MTQSRRRECNFCCAVSSLVVFLILLKYLGAPPKPNMYPRAKSAQQNPSTQQLLQAHNNTSLFQKAFQSLKAISGFDLKICETCKRPSNDRNRFINDLWYFTKAPTVGEVMVFGAYLDTRPNVGQDTVRIFGVASTPKEQSIFCQLWFPNVPIPVVIPAKIDDTGRGLGVSGVKYQEKLYSCAITAKLNTLPESVSIAFKETDNATIIMPLHKPSENLEHEIGICVVVTYGNLDPRRLVEWIEFNKLLGIGEINVYDSRINVAARKVFENYQLANVVHLRKSAPPMTNWCKWCQKLAAIPVLNDCMYRNMYRYKHLMVIDFDEIIVPKKHKNISSLIANLRRTWKDEPPAYMFHNAFFFTDYPQHYDKPSYLFLTRYLTRTEVSRKGYSPKSIVNPRRCLVMQNHYCMMRTKDVSGTFTLSVDPSIALSQHYKLCHLPKMECQQHIQHPILDTSVTKFSAALNESVYGKLKELFLIN